MHNLLLFLNRYKNFIFFLFLEGVSFWMIFSNNSYQGTAFYNFTNDLSGQIYTLSTDLKNYFRLKEINQNLMNENSLLMQRQVGINKDTLLQYKVFNGYVVNNSIYHPNNYITINKGKLHNIEPGMGVISENSVIGIVRFVSDHFAVVTSLLNTKILFSAKLKNANAAGSINWDGADPMRVQLKFIPKHVPISLGDTVITSGYSTVFPENLLFGTISTFSIEPGENFYTIQVTLSKDFSILTYVYILNNTLRDEQNGLEQKNETN